MPPKIAALFLFLALTSQGMASEATMYVEIPTIPPVVAKPGAKSVISIPVQVASGYHVQSNPASAPQLIPTTLEITTEDSLKLGKVVYPKGKPYRLQGSANEISAYEGTFELKVPLDVEKKAKVGKHVLTGKLRYQACNEKNCFFPTSIALQVPVEIR